MQIIEKKYCPIDGTLGEIRYKNVYDLFFGTAGQWTYKHNPKTGHLWLDPCPSADSLGEIYANYYTHAVEDSALKMSLWRQSLELALSKRLGYPKPAKASLLAKFVSKLPTVLAAAELEVMKIPASKSGSLLDVGCGSGTFLRRMRNAGFSVTGTEPDINAAARLTEREGFPVYCSIDDLLSERSHRFDIIVLSHVIEHVPSPLQTLKELKGLLKDDGRLLLTTPNAISLGSRIFGKSWRGLEPPRHFNVFTPDSLRYALNEAGYRIVMLGTEVRLARGIWFLSFLARAGGSDLEIKSSRPPHVMLKFFGYFFQIIEAMLVKIVPNIGEEIFCEVCFDRTTMADH